VTISVQAGRQFYNIVESNQIEKSIRQRESNRIIFFPESECSTGYELVLGTIELAWVRVGMVRLG